jgi:hypothetical protein
MKVKGFFGLAILKNAVENYWLKSPGPIRTQNPLG